MLIRLFLAGILLLLPELAAAEDWSEFRGPTGQGVSSATNVPAEWGTTKNVLWKAAIPGRGWSSPVLSENRVYLTTAIKGESATTLRALCIDANRGEIVWNAELFRPAAEQLRAMHKKNSPASPTPLVAAGKLYVHFGHLGTAALDLSGNVLWRQEIQYPPVHGNGGSPVLVGDSLIFNCDGGSEPFVVALDAGTGKERWRTPRNSDSKAPFSFSTPIAIEVDGQTQVISPASGFVGAYDPRDGREIWRVHYGTGYSVIPRPVFAHGLVIVSSGYDDAVIYAIRPRGARGDATSSHIAWQNSKGAPNTPSPLVVGDELYFVSDAGVASCLDVRTGKVHWSERLDGNYSASPVSAEGKVYFQTEDGVGYVVKASKKFELLAENDLEERSLASYAVTDGALFIRTEKHLWKIGG